MKLKVIYMHGTFIYLLAISSFFIYWGMETSVALRLFCLQLKKNAPGCATVGVFMGTVKYIITNAQDF